MKISKEKVNFMFLPYENKGGNLPKYSTVNEIHYYLGCLRPR